ncbi:hypothetical protein [Aquimonas sp.]|uniref:hypothetical protein n=1 Tax=Aquimonas sp. TaxID=1872588 RepID=UPI0037C06B77
MRARAPGIVRNLRDRRHGLHQTTWKRRLQSSAGIAETGADPTCMRSDRLPVQPLRGLSEVSAACSTAPEIA